jgi:hypothetical protein
VRNAVSRRRRLMKRHFRAPREGFPTVTSRIGAASRTFQRAEETFLSAEMIAQSAEGTFQSVEATLCLATTDCDEPIRYTPRIDVMRPEACGTQV